MSLWDEISPKKREMFLRASKPAQVTGASLNTSCETFVLTLKDKKNLDSDEIGPLAESFRHALLTRVEGFGVTALRLRSEAEIQHQGIPVLHKYGRLNGVKESVRAIVSALEHVVLRLQGRDSCEAVYELDWDPQDSAERELKAGALSKPEIGIEVVNSDLTLLHFTGRPVRLHMTLHIQKGRGFVSNEEMRAPWRGSRETRREVFLIPLSVNFSPVIRVGYRSVERQRHTVSFEVETKGNVTPAEAWRQGWDDLNARHRQSRTGKAK